MKTRKFTSPNRLAIHLSLLAAAALTATPAFAATKDWSATAATVNWNTGANWVGGSPPVNDLLTDIARFNQTGYLTQPSPTSNGNINGLIFGDGTTPTAAVVLDTGGGTNRFNVGGSGIVMNANSGTATIGVAANDGINLGANQAWQNDSSSLLTVNSMANDADVTPFTLTLSGSGSGGTSITGVVANGGTTGTTAIIVNKTGGAVTLGGANTFTGGLTLNAGTLMLNNNAALGAATNVFTINGGTVDVTGVRSTTNNNAQNWNGNFTFGGTNTWNTGTGAVTMNASRTVTVTSSTMTVDGAISESGGSFSLTKAGAGTLTLANANSYTGTTTINNSGVLQIGNGGTTGSLSTSSAIVINNTNAKLTFDRSNTITQGVDFANSISGTGIITTENAAGTVVLTGSNSYSGQTQIRAGTVSVDTLANFGTNSSLGQGTAGTGIMIGYSGTTSSLIYTGGATSTNRTVTIGNGVSVGQVGGATIKNNGTGALVFTAANFNDLNTTATAPSRTLTLGGSNAGEIQGIIGNNNGATSVVAVTKSDAGTWTLGGVNTYGGQTYVNAGTLVVSATGTIADGGVFVTAGEFKVNGIIGNGVVTIANGATLSGTGTIGGATTISGIHNPGNSPGYQTFSSDLTYSGGSSVTWELKGNTTANQLNPNAVFDTVVVNGNLNFAGATTLTLSMVTLANGGTVSWTDTFWSADKSGTNGWLIYDVAGTTSNFANLGTPNYAGLVDSYGISFSTAKPNGSFSFSQEGNDIYLNYTAVPEPAAWILAAFGLTTAVVFRRRRQA